MPASDHPQEAAPRPVPLRLGLPDPTTLLTPQLRAAMRAMISSPLAATALQYGAEQGPPDLISLLVEKINREQRLTIQPGNLMVVAGATHAIDLLARLYAKPDGVVLVEAPTFADALHIFRDHQLELCSVSMDEDGLIPSELERQIAKLQASSKSPAFLYTIPTFHNPTGRTTPEARRLEILRLAQRYGFLIVEDDVYRDLSFDGAVPPSYYALARGKQVCSIGSFSKTLAPGLRLGWLLSAEEIIQRCINCGTTQMGGGANPFAASIVAEYCRSGAWEAHIERLQTVYKERRNLALSALVKYMPAGVSWTHPTGGFFLWLSLPQNIFAQDVKHLALQQGVEVAAGEGYFVHLAQGAHHLRLAYSCAEPGEIDTGIRLLAQVIEQLRMLNGSTTAARSQT
ncbi:MAG TPA: PLP-dependent aminotransferase family protein [Ktedonobacterales bacterium]|jgi:DNA-binding transcriptional MocR family regulator